MALNKSMHPRNRYKDKPPDFAYLASKYPDFQKYVQTSLAGRAMLNFKEPEAVRELTCTLLKEDFGLTIQIPLERLIPTVPLRLNYIHWVEDLIGGQGEPRKGIDIGTGASCIYPLLGASMNGWYFLATEVDDMCFDFATKNVEQNNLSDLIKVVKVPQKTLLMDALKEETTIVYDFCMCNPPFFANQQEAKGVNSRSSRRPPPSSINTGGVTEIMAEGGELEFVKRIIHDSLQLKRRLRWYSCMLGKKCSLTPLKEELRKQGVPKVTQTEFCQGRTMRWALAWSFYDDVSVPSPPSKKRRLEKPRKPLSFLLLQPSLREFQAQAGSIGCTSSSMVDIITAWVEKILTDLRIQHKRVPCGKKEQSLVLTAVENTWIHGRQKRRDQNRQLREIPRALPGAGASPAPSTAPSSQTQQQSPTHSQEEPDKPAAAGAAAAAPTDQQLSGHVEANGVDSKGKSESEPQEKEAGRVPKKENSQDVNMESRISTTPPKHTLSAPITEQEDLATPSLAELTSVQEVEAATQDAVSSERPVSPTVQHFLFKSLVNIKMEENDVAVEMNWMEGQTKDLMNQLCTYMKNTLYRIVARP